jgi:hypothetical protein
MASSTRSSFHHRRKKTDSRTSFTRRFNGSSARLIRSRMVGGTGASLVSNMVAPIEADSAFPRKAAVF